MTVGARLGRRLTLAIAVAASIGVLIGAAPQPPAVWVRYVANAGVLVAMGDARVLIDAPIRDGISPYATSSAAERRQLEGAQAPYDRIDAILVTHWHEDHFSPDAVAAHLGANARAVLVSSPEVVERVRAAVPAVRAAQLRAVLPAPGASERVMVGQLPVHVLRIRHNPTRRLPEQHVGFLVGDGPAILHTGDADPAAANFTVLRGMPRVSLALVPFWFLTSEASRQFVRDSIQPAQIAALHLPPRDADDVSKQFVSGGVTAALFAVPGATVRMQAGGKKN